MLTLTSIFPIKILLRFNLVRKVLYGICSNVGERCIEFHISIMEFFGMCCPRWTRSKDLIYCIILSFDVSPKATSDSSQCRINSLVRTAPLSRLRISLDKTTWKFNMIKIPLKHAVVIKIWFSHWQVETFSKMKLHFKMQDFYCAWQPHPTPYTQKMCLTR